MSDREWHFYLDDILSFAEKVMSYTDNLTQSEFEGRSLNYDASLRNNDTLWSIIQDDIPELITALRDIRKSANNC